MKKLTICLTLLFTLLGMNQKANAQEVSGCLSYMTTGVAPIPAFALEGDAFYSCLGVDYDKVSIFVDMAFKGNGDIWFTDAWVQYNFVKTANSTFRVGANWSLTGQDYVDEANNEVVRETTRYLMFEVYGAHTIGDVSFSTQYWYSRGIGDRTINGHFFSVSAMKTFHIGEMNLSVNPGAFALDFTGNGDGVFLSGKTAVSHNDLPLELSFQAVPAVTSNIPGYQTQTTFALTYLF